VSVSKPMKRVPYPAASKVPGLEPQIWATPASDLCGPVRRERSADELAAELLVRRKENSSLPQQVPKMERRDPRASEGATRALSHCNNIVKLAGINKSCYQDASNTQALTKEGVINRERKNYLKFEARGNFPHGKRQPTLQDVSIVTSVSGPTLPPLPEPKLPRWDSSKF